MKMKPQQETNWTLSGLHSSMFQVSKNEKKKLRNKRERTKKGEKIKSERGRASERRVKQENEWRLNVFQKLALGENGEK